MFEVNSGFKRPKSKVLIVAGTAAFVIVLAVAGYFGWQYFSLKDNPNKVNQEAVARITAAVGNVFMLPDEKPTVAQVQDKDKLKDQSFFDKAENGDYVLVFEKAKLAIVYREKVSKLVNVGPISVADTPQPQAVSPAPADPKKK